MNRERIDTRNLPFARAVFIACALFLVPCGHAAAQAPLALPDGAPVVSMPAAGGGAWVVYADGSAALIELRDGAVIVRQTITTSPQVFEAEWKDRSGITHRVKTDCRNITVVECLKRHDEAVRALIALYPAQP